MEQNNDKGVTETSAFETMEATKEFNLDAKLNAMHQEMMKSISNIERKVDRLESKLDELISPCTCHRGVRSPIQHFIEIEDDLSEVTTGEPRVEGVTISNSDCLSVNDTKTIEDNLSNEKSTDSDENLKFRSNSNDEKQDEDDIAFYDQEEGNVTLPFVEEKDGDKHEMNDKNSVNSDDQIQDMNRVNSGVANDVNTDDKAERDELNKMILEAVEDIETVVNGKESGKDLNEIHVPSIYGNSLEIPANLSMDPSLENDDVNHSIDAHTFNNQIASLSGLRNDQGMTDNRFSQDAHVPVPQISSSLFTNLSNSSWIKSGTWKTDETNLKHQLRELLEQQTRSCRSCTCLRSVGIDTVICLDTSQSMEGLPLENAKSAIIQFINGLEQNALDYDLEENVAVVVFGNENKILCHLTNDYGDIIDKIAQITACGPSPLWVGLALALTEIKERGKIITVGESHILPRIILLTDGYPTPQCVLYGEDNYIHDVEETKQDILKCLGKCRQFTRTIDCIQVGQSDQTMLHKLAGDTGGRIYCTDDVPYLTQFFRIQDLANDYSTRISSGEIIVDDVVQMLKKTDLTERAQVEIIELLKGDKSIRTTIQEEKRDERRLENQDNANVQNDNVTVDPNPETNNDSIVGHEQRNEEHKNKDQESTIPEMKEPEFGESVVATETCADYQELKNMAGTVIGPLKQGMVKIVWSDGTVGKYRYGQAEKYDVKIVPALGYGLTDVRIGAIVERGPDWKWKDQDGGAGTIGVLTSFTDTIAVVIWSHGGQGNYRYGYSKKYDIKLYDNRTRSNSLETTVAWQVLVNQTWHTFEPETSNIIENMSNSQPNKEFVVKFGDLSLRISLKDQAAINLNTRIKYSIRRHDQGSQV